MNAHFSIHVSMALFIACILTVFLTRKPQTKHSSRLRLLWRFDGTLIVWAVLPFVLMKMGVPVGVFDSQWMNVFVLFPLLKHGIDGGMLIGQTAALGILGLQYAYLLWAIRNAGIRQQTT